MVLATCISRIVLAAVSPAYVVPSHDATAGRGMLTAQVGSSYRSVIKLHNYSITQLQNFYHSPAFISFLILRFIRSRFRALMWLM